MSPHHREGEKTREWAAGSLSDTVLCTKKKKKKLYDVFPQKKKITFLIYKPELQGIYFLLLKCNFCFVFFSLVLAFRIGIIVPIMTV